MSGIKSLIGIILILFGGGLVLISLPSLIILALALNYVATGLMIVPFVIGVLMAYGGVVLIRD